MLIVIYYLETETAIFVVPIQKELHSSIFLREE